MSESMASSPENATPTGPQIWRMQRLIEWLRSGEQLTTRLAAETFEVSRRTVAADLDHLRSIGVPLEYDRARETYVLTEPFENLPLIPLRRTELAAFLVAQHALEALGDTPHAQLMEQVTARLAEHLPETIRVPPEMLTRTIRFEAGPRPPVPLATLEALEPAIRNQQLVRIRYLSNSRDEETERDVEPYTLLSYQGRWYVIGYCRLRKDMRDFRLDRIRALRATGEPFTIPEDFDLEAYLGPAFGMHRGERTYAVHVRFTPYQARWIREEKWHDSQVMALRKDKSLDLRMQVAGLTDLTRWVLSYGAECEVISPPVLRHRIAAEARKMAETYAKVGTRK
jgi:predicted DNA-binding transcriptional regulator YafY